MLELTGYSASKVDYKLKIYKGDKKKSWTGVTRTTYNIYFRITAQVYREGCSKSVTCP